MLDIMQGLIRQLLSQMSSVVTSFIIENEYTFDNVYYSFTIRSSFHLQNYQILYNIF